MLAVVFAMASLPATAQTTDEDQYPLLCKHCQEVAMDCYGIYDISRFPPFKVAYWCSVSKEAFFEADEVPSGAPVHDISEVVNRRTQQPLPSDYVVNADSLNYFAYNFMDFERMHKDQGGTVYYRTTASKHPYLGVRRYFEAKKSVNNSALLPYGLLPDNYFAGK